MRYLFVVLTLLIIIGCSHTGPIESFEGYFHTVESSNTLRINCSSAAKREATDGTEIGYMCRVRVTESTIIETEEGKTLNVEDLAEFDVEKTNTPTRVQVVLTEAKDINTTSRSREGLNASKIVISN